MACVSSAVRERERNLRRLRQLRATAGTDATRAELTRRNGELTGALVDGMQSFRSAAAAPPATLA